MKKILLVLCISTTTLCLFDYDRAVSLAQQEQWQDAGRQLNMLVAERPDNPELLYDAGVVAFNNEDYQQAKAYFEAAAQKDTATRVLKEQTYFNKGNTQVALQELKEALLSYEQVLMLNADNEQAQHNHEMVKKMLEQQEQQQQDQQQENQDSQSQDSQNQDQQSKQQQEQDSDKKDEDKDSKGKDQQGGNQDQSSGGNSQGDESQGSQDANRDDQEQESKQDPRDDDRLDQDSDQQDQQEGGPDKKQEKPDQNKQRDEGSNSDQSTKEAEQEQQREQQDDHQLPFDEQTEPHQQDMQEQQKEQGMEQQQADAVPLDPKLQQVLAKRSDRDAQLNKQLVKALVSQEMKGQDGQNCW